MHMDHHSLVDPSVNRGHIVPELLRLEPESNLSLRRLHRVGAVDNVAAHVDRIVAPDRPWRGGERIGGPDHGPASLDNVLPLPHHRHHRPRGDVVHQLAEEGLALVLTIVDIGQVAAGHQHLDPHQLVPTLLKALDNVTHQTALNALWLDLEEGLSRLRVCSQRSFSS